MKLSDFKLTSVQGSSALNKEFFATVEVEETTGFLFKKHTKQKREIRRKYAGSWHFIDTGEYTPDDQAEKLARAWEAQTGQET